jgi:hypothetical protein
MLHAEGDQAADRGAENRRCRGQPGERSVSQKPTRRVMELHALILFISGRTGRIALAERRSLPADAERSPIMAAERVDHKVLWPELTLTQKRRAHCDTTAQKPCLKRRM